MTAWTIPMVQAVAAVPAFAVSGPANISTTTGTVKFTADSSGNQKYTVTVTLKNSGGSQTTGLTATLAWTPVDKHSGDLGTTGTPTGTAVWTRVSGGQNSWTAGTQIVAGGTQSFTLTGTINKEAGNHPVKGSLLVTFMASGSSAAASGSI